MSSEIAALYSQERVYIPPSKEVGYHIHTQVPGNISDVMTKQEVMAFAQRKFDKLTPWRKRHTEDLYKLMMTDLEAGPDTGYRIAELDPRINPNVTPTYYNSRPLTELLILGPENPQGVSSILGNFITSHSPIPKVPYEIVISDGDRIRFIHIQEDDTSQTSRKRGGKKVTVNYLFPEYIPADQDRNGNSEFIYTGLDRWGMYEPPISMNGTEAITYIDEKYSRSRNRTSSNGAAIQAMDTIRKDLKGEYTVVTYREHYDYVPTSDSRDGEYKKVVSQLRRTLLGPADENGYHKEVLEIEEFPIDALDSKENTYLRQVGEDGVKIYSPSEENPYGVVSFYQAQKRTEMIL